MSPTFFIAVALLVSAVSAQVYFHESFHGTDTSCTTASARKYITWRNDTCQPIGQSQSFQFFCLSGEISGYSLLYYNFNESSACTGPFVSFTAQNGACLDAATQGYIKLYCDTRASAATAATYQSASYSNNQCTAASEPGTMELPTSVCLNSESGSTSTKYFCYANRTTQMNSYSLADCTGDETVGPLVSIDQCAMNGNTWNQRTCNNFAFDPAPTPVAAPIDPNAPVAPPTAQTAPVAPPTAQTAPVAPPTASNAPVAATAPIAANAPAAAPKASNTPVVRPPNSASSTIASLAVAFVAAIFVCAL